MGLSMHATMFMTMRRRCYWSTLRFSDVVKDLVAKGSTDTEVLELSDEFGGKFWSNSAG